MAQIIDKIFRDDSERICLHKNNGCSMEKACDGRGCYQDQKTREYTDCHRAAYREIELWRTNG